MYVLGPPRSNWSSLNDDTIIAKRQKISLPNRFSASIGGGGGVIERGRPTGDSRDQGE